MPEPVSQIAACAACTKSDCGTVVILPSIPDHGKRFDFQNHYLEVVCPACHRPFAIGVGEIFFQDVTDNEISAGYILL